MPRIPAAHIDIFSDPPMLLKERGLLVSRRGRTLRLGPFVVLQVEQDRLVLLERSPPLASLFKWVLPWRSPVVVGALISKFPVLRASRLLEEGKLPLLPRVLPNSSMRSSFLLPRSRWVIFRLLR